MDKGTCMNRPTHCLPPREIRVPLLVDCPIETRLLMGEVLAYSALTVYAHRPIRESSTTSALETEWLRCLHELRGTVSFDGDPIRFVTEIDHRL